MGRMQRTQIYLEPELARGLDRLAERRGVSRAEVIRLAAREYLRSEEGERDPIWDIVGMGEGPGDDAAEEHDRVLVEMKLSKMQ